jgi:hypothetical protein
MAISRRPKRTSSETKAVDVDALISKGGSVAGNNKVQSKEKRTTPVIVRVPDEILEKVDSAVQARPIKTPRHTWLLESIFEKLERESA